MEKEENQTGENNAPRHDNIKGYNHELKAVKDHGSGNGYEDKLDFLFRKQKDLFTGPAGETENKMANLYRTSEPFDGYRLFMLSTALVHEAIELQMETNWKWWKKETAIDFQRTQEEIIDIWHFLIQLSIESGLDPKMVVEKYMEKNRENLNRQSKGY